MKKNILLVDDDEITNFLNEKVISSTGLINKILKASNGREALKVLNKATNGGTPDVILLDLNMPIMNGFEFLKAFQDLDPEKKNVVIIVVTSSFNPMDIEKAKSFGIRHYITKPITAENIKAIIHEEFNETQDS